MNMFLYYVYAYDMYEAERLDIWPQRIASAVISYHEDVRHAHMCVNNMINNDFSGVYPGECWAIGAIPFCHDFDYLT